MLPRPPLIRTLRFGCESEPAVATNAGLLLDSLSAIRACADPICVHEGEHQYSRKQANAAEILSQTKVVETPLHHDNPNPGQYRGQSEREIDAPISQAERQANVNVSLIHPPGQKDELAWQDDKYDQEPNDPKGKNNVLSGDEPDQEGRHPGDGSEHAKELLDGLHLATNLVEGREPGVPFASRFGSLDLRFPCKAVAGFRVAAGLFAASVKSSDIADHAGAA